MLSTLINSLYRNNFVRTISFLLPFTFAACGAENNLSPSCGEERTAACGKNERGTQTEFYNCDSQSWVKDLFCNDSDQCFLNEEKKVYSGLEGSERRGLCQEGLEKCLDTVEGAKFNLIQPEITPQLELCDGLDNDCDGVIDNGFNIGFPCTTGTGECINTGSNVCSRDGLNTVCEITPKAQNEEICDGKDNDCDGITDNNLNTPTQPCFTGVGECTSRGLEYKICRGAQGWSEEYLGCDALAKSPTIETCDGLDNDCDNLTDEELTAPSRECVIEAGGCRSTGREEKVCYGTEGWSFDYLNCNAPPIQPASEVCDGLDNDCDNIIDNGFKIGESCSEGTGACLSSGNYTCAPDQLTSLCSAIPKQPASETCDNIDNDCDGRTDEDLNQIVNCGYNNRGEKTQYCDSGHWTNSTSCQDLDSCTLTNVKYSYTGPEGTVDIGQCKPQIETCLDNANNTAQWQTTQNEVHPSAEICDGKDNNCDRITDNDFGVGEECTSGKGECLTSGRYVCNSSGTGTICDALPKEPTLEDCDGKDNDCNGIIDDADKLIPPKKECATGEGICRSTGLESKTCLGAEGWSNEYSNCTAIAGQPTTELCDNLDNNCDSLTDEDLTQTVNCGYNNRGNKSQNCDSGNWIDSTLCQDLDLCVLGNVKYSYSGPEGTADVGKCKPQVETCLDVNNIAQWQITQNEVHPSIEICDGLDNDCNNFTDEELVKPSRKCSIQVGGCSSTGNEYKICLGAEGWSSTYSGCDAPLPQPSVELCDGVDNDCDGLTDNHLATPSRVCSAGEGECKEWGIEHKLCLGTNGWSEEYSNCTALPKQPSAERCDYKDNDCDGITDQGFNVGEDCTTGTGVCLSLGNYVCSSNGEGTLCDALIKHPTGEICDSLDNDCDSLTDEELTHPSQECIIGVGECRSLGRVYKTCLGEEGWSSTYSGCDAPIIDPISELCDGKDNDCDGITDNGFNVGEICSDGEGECLTLGNYLCDENGSGTTCDASPRNQLEEICDGKDNNCDGLTDENLNPPQRECTKGLGECIATGLESKTCLGTAGWSSEYSNCTAIAGQPTIEICDGKDNDCEGTTDNGFNVGETCSQGVGECQNSGQYVCNAEGTGTFCSASAGQPIGEMCDGLDNDCDSSTDEELIPPSEECIIGIGECRSIGRVYKTCLGAEGWSSTYSGCDAPIIDPISELCDGLDNDCEGIIDNGYNVGEPCSAGEGACLVAGNYACNPDGSGTACDAVAGDLTTEACDGIDNDCNGTIDDNLTPPTQECTTGIGACVSVGLESKICNGLEGWSSEYSNCTAVAGQPTTEICDRLDNDCDGLTDNGFNVGETCSAGEGECITFENYVCNESGSGTICNAVPGQPTAEICDGLDNDCDGLTDNGALDNSILAYYPLDGDGTDRSPTMNHGVVKQPGVTTVEGSSGTDSTGMRFSASCCACGEGRIAAPYNPQLNFGVNSFTLMLWMKHEPIGNIACGYIADAFSIRTNDEGMQLKILDEDYLYLNYTGKPFLWLYSTPPTRQCGNNFVMSTQRIDNGQWHHVAFVRAGSNMDIYIDGNFDKNVDIGANCNIHPTTSPKVIIGSGWESTGPSWNGDLDELIISSRSFTADEIFQYYDSGSLCKK